MTIADRLKMFEQAAASNTTASRPTTAAKSWGAARGPSIAEQIKKIADNDSSLSRVDLSNQAAYQCKPEEYTAQLAAAIKKNKYLKELRLEGCGLGDREAAVLAESIAVNTSINVIDLQKNRIGSDGGAALASGIAKNSSLVEINLMHQPSKWGDGCLDAFLSMFETNITLLKITWRLESRKSFALNKLITRNNEIDRRKKNGMAYHDLLPTALKGSDEGKENINIPAHTALAPANPDVLPAPSSSSSSSSLSAQPQVEPQGPEQPRAVSASTTASSGTQPAGTANGAPRWGAGAGGQVKIGGGSMNGTLGGVGAEADGKAGGVPKAKKTPSVLSRWPPSQQES